MLLLLSIGMRIVRTQQLREVTLKNCDRTGRIQEDTEVSGCTWDNVNSQLFIAQGRKSPELTLEQCTFNQCSAETSIISLQSGSFEMRNCGVSNSKITGADGSFIYSSVVEVTISDCRFENCSSNGNGGAICIKKTLLWDSSKPSPDDRSRVINITNCTAINCRSNVGGFLYHFSGAKLQLENITCSECNSTEKDSGQAIHIAAALDGSTTTNCCILGDNGVYRQFGEFQGEGMFKTWSTTTEGGFVILTDGCSLDPSQIPETTETVPVTPEPVPVTPEPVPVTPEPVPVTPEPVEAVTAGQDGARVGEEPEADNTTMVVVIVVATLCVLGVAGFSFFMYKRRSEIPAETSEAILSLKIDLV